MLRLLHLGWMDKECTINKNEPSVITNESTPTKVSLYDRWEKSNRLSVMFIKAKVTTDICGYVDQHENVLDLLKVIDEQFIT